MIETRYKNLVTGGRSQQCGLPPAIISTAAHINAGGRPNSLTLAFAPFYIGTFSLFARHFSPSTYGVIKNTFGVIENTLGVFKITFGVLIF